MRLSQRLWQKVDAISPNGWRMFIPNFVPKNPARKTLQHKQFTIDCTRFVLIIIWSRLRMEGFDVHLENIQVPEGLGKE